MKQYVDKLLGAINLANYEGLNSIMVKVSDLMILRERLLSQGEVMKKMQKEIIFLQTKINISSIEKPIKLDVFFDKYV